MNKWRWTDCLILLTKKKVNWFPYNIFAKMEKVNWFPKWTDFRAPGTSTTYVHSTIYWSNWAQVDSLNFSRKNDTQTNNIVYYTNYVLLSAKKKFFRGFHFTYFCRIRCLYLHYYAITFTLWRFATMAT